MQGARILIIDDDERIYHRIRRLLSDRVGRIAWAERPEEGLRMALSDPPDVVLLDINMPNMDGLKVCRHLKEASRTRDVPVLFLTVDSNMNSLARALDCGGADYILKPFNEVDLRSRLRVALRTKQMIDLLKERARLDALTGLANRAAFDDALAAAMSERERLGHPFALLMLDVDRFKQINDRHGHAVGDELLRELASGIRTRCRPYDTPCRFGGDEFGVILGQIESSHARSAARRIIGGVTILPERDDRLAIEARCSAGLASSELLPDGFDTGDIVKAADVALYRAKQQGRNRLCC